METISQQITSLYQSADDKGRKSIQDVIRDLMFSFDSDFDVFLRIASGPLQFSMAKLGVDLRIFELLNDEKKPLTSQELAEKTGAEESLLGHILRTQAAFGMIQETGEAKFTANRLTRLFSDSNVAGAVNQLFNIPGPPTQALPDFLKERKYKNIISNNDTVFQKAFDTKLTLFQWMSEHPEHMISLGQLMALQRVDHWVDSYPVEKEVESFAPSPEKHILVDVGGGFGQQAIAFRNRYPNIPGRIVVQDIPETLAGATPVPGIEFAVHDFFQPQPVRGAKFYYLRHVLHNWPDEKCVEILKATIGALGTDSSIVIDEVVLPDMGVPWQAAYLDMTMMISLGGIERTRKEYENLLDQAGLRITNVHQYDAKMQSVIFAVPQ